MTSKAPAPDYRAPLQRWLAGTAWLKQLIHYEEEGHFLTNGWVYLEVARPLYEARDLRLTAFSQAWEQTVGYVARACKLVRRTRWGGRGLGDKGAAIQEELGPAPVHCYPLYFLTVKRGASERIVYIGKTNARSHRFASGHAAITKLHAPEFEGYEKRVYLATVTFMTDEENYLPIEWIHPRAWRESLLDGVESQLIFDYQPQLNSKKTKTFCARQPLLLEVRCEVSDSGIGDRLVCPPKWAMGSISDDTA